LHVHGFFKNKHERWCYTEKVKDSEEGTHKTDDIVTPRGGTGITLTSLLEKPYCALRKEL
jgi:hypothetical protein